MSKNILFPSEITPETEKRLKKAEFISRTGNWEFFIDSGELNGSDGAARLLGMDRNYFDYHSVGNIILPEFLPVIYNSYKNLVENNAAFEVEFRVRRKDNGELRDMMARAIFDKENRKVFGTIQDITRHKNPGVSQKNNTSLQSAMIMNIGTVINIIDADGNLNYISPNIEKWFGWYPEDFKTNDFWFTVHPMDIESVRKAFNNLLEKENALAKIEFRFQCKDKTHKWVELVAVNNMNNPDINGILVNFHDISERKHMEIALLDSERKHRQLVENIHDIIYTITVDGTLTFVSPAFEAQLGYPVSEVVGKPFTGFIHPDDSPKCVSWLQKTLESGAFNEGIEFRARHIDQSWRWYTSGVVVLKDKEGSVTGFEGIARNISEQKRAEELLALTRQNYEVFFNTISDLLFVLDGQGNIINMNNTVIDKLGYSREELLGNSVLMVHPEERRNEAGRIVGEMLAGTAEYCPVPVITKSGEQIPVETRVNQGIWDGKPAIFGVTKDISKIKYSEEKFSKVFYLNPSACGLSDIETGEYVEVNDSFYTLLGFNKDEVIGKTAIQLGILSSEVKNEVMRKSTDGEKFINVEATLKAKDGSIKQVLLSAENIYIQNKKLRYTVVNDITELKKVEEVLRKSEITLKELNASKDKLFSIIAHDLRSPFNSIIGFSDLLLENIQSNEKRRLEYATIINTTAKHTLDLVENLLAWAKAQSGLIDFNPEKLELKAVIMQIVNMLNSAAMIKNISISIHADNVVVFADPNMLRTILRNLIQNAVKFTNIGGKVDIDAIEKPGEVLISITDNGIGIGRKTINQLFGINNESLKAGTANEKGSGLGLVLCKEFVEKHGGTISAVSNPDSNREGKGSSFIFSLPIH